MVVIAIVFPVVVFIEGKHLHLGRSERARRGVDCSMCRTLINPTFFLSSLIYVLMFLCSKPFSF